MDSRAPGDADDRPSIFSRPDDDDFRPSDPPHDTPGRHGHQAATDAHQVSGPLVVQAREATPDGAAEARRAPPVRTLSRAQLASLGVVGVLILALVGAVAASMLRGPDDERIVAGASGSAQPSALATVEASGSPEPSEAAAPSASPLPTSPSAAAATPVPTPAGPPHELTTGGWATVSVGELHVRRDPGLSATSVYRLVRGAVVHLPVEPPSLHDGYAWYRVESLGGARGWAASGPQGTPYLTMLTSESYLLHCGLVEDPVFDAVDGTVEVRDPITIGGLALPAARFTDVELGLFELVRSIRGDACFGVEADTNGALTVFVDTAAWACGRPEVSDGIRRMRPAAGTDAVAAIQVKDTAIVHPAVLTSLLGNERSSASLRGVFDLTAANDGATGCLELRITASPGVVDHYQSVQAVQCVVVESWNGVELVVRPASGGGSVTLYPSQVDEGIVTEQSTAQNVDAWDDSRGSGGGLTENSVPGCG